MRDLRDVAADVADQDKGAWLDLADPIDGKPTGLRFRIAGPDSATQHRAQLQLVDELAELAGPDGRVTAAHRETARINCLARCVLGWEVEEDGQPVPFNQRNVVRVLNLARWVEAQIDAFAGDRRNFGAR